MSGFLRFVALQIEEQAFVLPHGRFMTMNIKTKHTTSHLLDLILIDSGLSPFYATGADIKDRVRFDLNQPEGLFAGQTEKELI